MTPEVTLADWSTDKASIKFIRLRVFVEEQKVPEELEWDEHDKTALHCLAKINGEAVATGRLQTDGQLGRMAVLKPFRKLGIGTEVLKFLIKQQKLISDSSIIIHAQKHAINFYKKFGFVKQGDEYNEAGIPHYTMILNK